MRVTHPLTPLAQGILRMDYHKVEGGPTYSTLCLPKMEILTVTRHSRPSLGALCIPIPMSYTILRARARATNLAYQVAGRARISMTHTQTAVAFGSGRW